MLTAHPLVEFGIVRARDEFAKLARHSFTRLGKCQWAILLLLSAEQPDLAVILVMRVDDLLRVGGPPADMGMPSSLASRNQGHRFSDSGRELTWRFRGLKF